MKDISRDQDALNYLVSNGFMSVPVTKIGEEHVVGFDPARFEALLG